MRKITALFPVVVGIIGIAINAGYAIYFLYALFAHAHGLAIDELTISVFALQASWAVLFVWFLVKPAERRDILLIALVPMSLANVLQSVFIAPDHAVANTVSLLVFAGLFYTGYRNAGRQTPPAYRR